MSSANDHDVTKKNTGINRIVKAFGYSINGLKAAWRGEAAFRQELLLLVALIPILLLVNLTNIERCLLVLVTLLVIIVELLNSGIEAVVDRIGTDHHPLSGQAKDIASAAVLLSLILCAYVWADILLTAFAR